MAHERDVQAARDAVVEAAANASRAYLVWDEDIIGGGFDFRLAMIDLHDTLHTLDALQAEPPEDAEQCGSPHGSCVVFRIGDLAHCQTCNKHWSESAEPELPPRGESVWREMMARVDHEGGC